MAGLVKTWLAVVPWEAVVSINAAHDVEVEESRRVLQPIVKRAAADLRPAAKKSKISALGLNVSVSPATSLVRDHIDDAAGRICSVERGTRPTQYFNAIGRDEIQIREKLTGIALCAGSVA